MEEDVQDILCGPNVNVLREDVGQWGRPMVMDLRQKDAFVNMVNSIVARNAEAVPPGTIS